MFKSMKRIIRWSGKYKRRLYLGSVFSFFSSLSTAIPTMGAAYALVHVYHSLVNISHSMGRQYDRVILDLADAFAHHRFDCA